MPGRRAAVLLQRFSREFLGVSEVPITDRVEFGLPGHGRVNDFDGFYVRELPRLIALARGLCGSALAEDVAQEAMLAAYRRWRDVGDLERPDLWVRRTCANLAVSQFRRRLIELRTVAHLRAQGPAPSPLTSPTEEFWHAVRSLPHRQANAAALRFIYDLPIADIAVTLDCTEGTVKQHLSRARQALIRTLGEPEEES